MKKVFLLCALLVIAVPQIAAADHIGVYSDVTGSSCSIAPGFTSTTAVVHKFSVGTTGSRFRIAFPVGTTVYGFTTYASFGYVQTGIEVYYGQCKQGSWVVGTLTAYLAPGVICVHPAIGFPEINSFSCTFGELSATGGSAMVGSPCEGNPPCGGPLAVESSTWGSVKSLYR